MLQRDIVYVSSKCLQINIWHTATSNFWNMLWKKYWRTILKFSFFLSLSFLLASVYYWTLWSFRDIISDGAKCLFWARASNFRNWYPFTAGVNWVMYGIKWVYPRTHLGLWERFEPWTYQTEGERSTHWAIEANNIKT